MDRFGQGVGMVRPLEDRLGAGWDLGCRTARGKSPRAWLELDVA